MQAQSPELSAHDVNLLHQIILRAQDQVDYHKHPNKVLFDSYDAVFAEKGLDTHHDRACLRLLLQLGGPGIPGDSLYEKFEHLLEQAGIVLRFEEDGESVAEALHDVAEEGEEEEDNKEHFPEDAADKHTSPRKVERRNSFTTLYDVAANAMRIQQPRRLSWGSDSRMRREQLPPAPKTNKDHVRASLPQNKDYSVEDSEDAFTRTSFGEHGDLRPARSPQLLRPGQIPALAMTQENDIHTREQLFQIMEIAAEKDRLTLLRQAFTNWRSATPIIRQQRRLHEIEIALDRQQEVITERADQAYKKDLVYKAFCHWAYTALEVRTKTEAARKWYLSHKYFLCWAKHALGQELKAQRFAKVKMFKKWIANCQLKRSQNAILEERVRRMQDWRLARQTFTVWNLRTRMIQKADAVSERCTKLRALLNWRDVYHAKEFFLCSEHRLLEQSFYRWIVAGRSAVHDRILDRRRKSEALQTLLAGFRQRKGTLLTRESEVIRLRNGRLLKSAWECWKLQMSLEHERSRMALEFYNPKIEFDYFTIWRDRVKHIERQELRAQDANFYFLTTKAIKLWHAAAVDSKKRRINDAYKRTRKMVKVNMLRNIITKWQVRVQQIIDMQHTSLARNDQKSRGAVQRIFVNWQISTSQLQQSAHHASAHYESVLLNRTLRSLLDTSRELRTLETRADEFYNIRISEICSAQLRRISMKAFEIKRRQDDADAMRQRHFAKHLRNILRHWVFKTKDVLLVPQKPSPSTEHEPTDAGYGTGTGTATAAGSFVEHPALLNPNAGSAMLGATQRAEEWTAFDQDLLEMNMTPGYLNTPSKRAARVRALVNASTTPATPWTAQRPLGLGPPSKRAHLFGDLG